MGINKNRISILKSFLFSLVIATPVVASPSRIFGGVPGVKKKPFVANKGNDLPSWTIVPRGGESVPDFTPPVVSENASANGLFSVATSALQGLSSSMKGPKADTLLLLLTTALNTPISKMIGTSPILGYLFFGLLFGPNGFGLVKDIHTTELMADIGIVFFLFEMGIHLDFKTLMKHPFDGGFQAQGLKPFDFIL